MTCLRNFTRRTNRFFFFFFYLSVHLTSDDRELLSEKKSLIIDTSQPEIDTVYTDQTSG